MRHSILKPLIFSLLLALLACNATTEPVKEGIHEGKITYDISFPTLEKNSFLASLLPSQITTYFKDSKVRTEMVYAYGTMKLVGISDSKAKSAYVLMDLFSGKHVVDDVDVEIGNKIKPYKMSPSSESQLIAGRQCQKIEIKDLTGNREFPVFLAESILAKDIYWNTPYRGLNGALMDFPLKSNNISMKLRAREVEPMPVSDSLFLIPKDYEPMTKAKFESVIKGLMSGNSDFDL